MHPMKDCIAIDVGNTRGKAVLFHGSEIIQRWEFDPGMPLANAELTQEIPEGLPIILSGVRPVGEEFLEFLRSRGPLLVLSGSTPLPFSSDYLTPETIGPDRLALVAGAIALLPGEDILVIDAGTCITCDLVTSGKLFLGGSISPGLDMRLRALKEFTGALPLVSKEEGNWFPGRSTRESILAGVHEGACGELRDRIEQLMPIYPTLKVVLTGGDAPYFVKNLKNSNFASPDLVVQGLRTILEHHVKTNH